ncbi:MAG: glycosyltransferase family 4 protein [Tabrizicola sp.]|nr:glycosyltransferase family 4 protein [Tabrizicola sp.]
MPAANAAIWYMADGYDPAARGINGRRVAGEGFLQGFFAHGDVTEFVCLAHSQPDHAAFAELAKTYGVTRPLRHVRLDAPKAMAPVDVVSYPGPLPPQECWRRMPFGATAWAVTGITHTTATQRVVQSFFDLRSAPQMPWDANICTSTAVQASLRRLMELAEEHLALRFPGAILPTRPLLPVIPLGVNCDAHQRDPASGAALRARLGIDPADVVAVCISRLTPDEKFDPLPLFLAMELAAAEVKAKGGGRLHLILCGQFREEVWSGVFARAAVQLMPSCGYHLLDGGKADERKATLSAGDMFVFPVDNVQETFGLAPVEAMAAGLPVVASDWDGMKDTVTPDTGFRIPTEMPRGGLADYLSFRHFGGTDGYLQYLGQLSAMTRIDVAALSRAIATLGIDPALRAKMGQAAQDRARRFFDWAAVIPQLQALWGEQSAMLHHARSRGTGQATAPRSAATIPVFPAPDQMFAAYPSAPPPKDRRLVAVPKHEQSGPVELFDLRGYANRRRLIDDPVRIETILAAFRSAGPQGLTEAEAVAATGLHPAIVARATLWLLKYHLLTEVP